MVIIKKEDVKSLMPLDKDTLIVVLNDTKGEYYDSLQSDKKCLKIENIEIICKNG